MDLEHCFEIIGEEDVLFNLTQLREVEVCYGFDFGWANDSADPEFMVSTALVSQIMRIFPVEMFL